MVFYEFNKIFSIFITAHQQMPADAFILQMNTIRIYMQTFRIKHPNAWVPAILCLNRLANSRKKSKIIPFIWIDVCTVHTDIQEAIFAIELNSFDSVRVGCHLIACVALHLIQNINMCVMCLMCMCVWHTEKKRATRIELMM